MTEQSTARIALRLAIQMYVPEHALSDALELVDVLYKPMELVSEYLGNPSSVIQPYVSSEVLGPLNNLPRADPFNTIVIPPLTPIGLLAQEPNLLPVLHTQGEVACGKPAYYLTGKIHRTKKTSLSKMRLVTTGKPPVPGVDNQVCGSCNQTINPFSRADVDLEPVFYTQLEERLMLARSQPMDPELERLNKESRRWDVSLQPHVEGLIGVAQTFVDPEQVLMPVNGNLGLPPEDSTPSLEDLPDPTQIEREF